MPQVVIENPIINSPFDEPTRHFRFADEGITKEIVAGRRSSSYFDGAADRLLDRSPPREEALLLPERSSGNGDLPGEKYDHDHAIGP